MSTKFTSPLRATDASAVIPASPFPCSYFARLAI